MTPIMLMQALQGFLKKETSGIIMTTRVKRNSTEPAERPPETYIGGLPEPEGNEKLAPYVLLKLLTGKHERNSGESENKCMVRIICVAYSEDPQDRYIQLLNLISKIEFRLLEQTVIDSRFSLQSPIEMIVYEEDTGPYKIGELMTTWELPTIKRKIEL